MDISLLRPVEVRLDGRRIALGVRKQRSVLAMLALHVDRTVLETASPRASGRSFRRARRRCAARSTAPRTAIDRLAADPRHARDFRRRAATGNKFAGPDDAQPHSQPLFE